jgi:dUTP pyrophosphatase
MAKFEVVSKYADCGLALPERKTKYSAGYDLAAAEDIVIPSYSKLKQRMECNEYFGEKEMKITPYTLSEMNEFTKFKNARPTLVSTGMKCKLDPDTYLELSVRSSSPLKYWLVLANGVGIIDADYYNNPDNEGEIFLQLINFSAFDIIIQKGEAIGQAIIKPYLTTEDDAATGERLGGFGSTTK